MTSALSVDKSSILSLTGVGPRVAEKLSRMGIESVQDILFHFPYRYEDRTRVVPIGALRQGHSALIEGDVDFSQIAFSRKGKSRRMLLCHMSDGTGSIVLRFFYFNKQQQNRLSKGARIRCFGEVRFGVASLEMIHPEVTFVDNESAVVEDALTPVYPLTEGVHQTLLRNIASQVIAGLEKNNYLQELLPQSILEKYEMPLLSEAISCIHKPATDLNIDELTVGLHPVKQRLAFEELLAHHLSLMLLRQQVNQWESFELSQDNGLVNRFYDQLPYSLTRAQVRVINDILEDVKSPHAMMRLVQGDVGSGKTVVAAVACLKAIEQGYQSVLMAPTEILAEQHYNNFTDWFESLGVSTTWLSGKVKGKERQQILEKIEAGRFSMIIGTHALFQKDVNFNNLAMVVIDEQHRFGVHQRLALRDKGQKGTFPHQLIMTATPIPRSLAMTAYADLDYSVIDELPPGRTAVKTSVLPDSRRAEIIARVKLSSGKGNQIYWVCTLIEESEALQCQAAQDTASELEAVLPELRIGLVHGRLSAKEKQSVMQAFKQGKIDLLVATTVIEVGVDVPNATLMIIENAERLGLAQLHQLRGRVGRGAGESHCLLMYKMPLSDNARQRLSIMREFSSGFDVARRDLELRGPGEVLGTRQTGEMEFKVADIIRDEYLLDDVKDTVTEMLNNHADRIPLLIKRWLGKADRYGQVG